MPNSFQRVKQGQLFRPNQQTANAMIAGAEQNQLHARDPGDAGDDRYAPSYQFEGICIDVRNDSGAVMPRYSVAGLGAPLITDAQNLSEFQNFVRFSVTTPAAANHAGKFCVLLRPLDKGAIGPAILCGVCPVQIRLTAAPPGGIWNADVADGQIGYLAPCGSGLAQVLWAAPAASSYPATVWAIVRIGTLPVDQVYQVVPHEGYPGPSDNLDAGGSCKVQAMTWNGSGYTLDTSATFTASDPQGCHWAVCTENIICRQHGAVLEVMSSGLALRTGTYHAAGTVTTGPATVRASLPGGASVADGASVTIGYVGGGWQVMVAPCTSS